MKHLFNWEATKLFRIRSVIEYFSDNYSNIIGAIRNPKIEQNGYELVSLPRSDFLCGGEYIIGNKDISTGSYVQKDNRIPALTTGEIIN